MLQTTDYLFSITPKEKFTYQDIYPHTPVTCLPLRRLGKYIGKYSRPIINRDTYNIFFMGSNYQIAHMYGALKFIVEEMNPLLQKTYPGTFKIHFIGSRMPAEIATKIKNGDYENVQYHGFVEDLDAFLGEMDIAISASLFGEGMQQKIFEPILRGIPTITNERGLAGYPFFDNVHVRTAEPTAESYVSILGDMRNAETRKKLSSRALKMAEELFDEAILKQLMNNAFQRVTQKGR